ncbi:hypothetical protein NN561_008011 [Cricetulus griseus]
MWLDVPGACTAAPGPHPPRAPSGISTCSVSGTREVAGGLRLQDRKTHRDFAEAPILSSPPSPPRAPGLAPSVRPPTAPSAPAGSPGCLRAGKLSGASRPRAPVGRPLLQGSLAQPTAAAAARPSPLTGSSPSSHLSAHGAPRAPLVRAASGRRGPGYVSGDARPRPAATPPREATPPESLQEPTLAVASHARHVALRGQRIFLSPRAFHLPGRTTPL